MVSILCKNFDHNRVRPWASALHWAAYTYVCWGFRGSWTDSPTVKIFSIFSKRFFLLGNADGGDSLTFLTHPPLLETTLGNAYFTRIANSIRKNRRETYSHYCAASTSCPEIADFQYRSAREKQQAIESDSLEKLCKRELKFIC